MKKSFIPKELRPDVDGQSLDLNQNLSTESVSLLKEIVLEDIIKTRSRRALIPKLIMHNINNPDKNNQYIDLLKIMFPKTTSKVKKGI